MILRGLLVKGAFYITKTQRSTEDSNGSFLNELGTPCGDLRSAMFLILGIAVLCGSLCSSASL